MPCLLQIAGGAQDVGDDGLAAGGGQAPEAGFQGVAQARVLASVHDPQSLAAGQVHTHPAVVVTRQGESARA